jgi:hypothetical protein
MKKLGLIAIIAVIALGAVGVGYAAWSQNFSITGNVATGKYDVVLTTGTATIINNDNAVATVSVGTTTSTGGSAGFSVTMTNAYPGLEIDVPVTVTNNSTIPVKVTGLTLTPPTGSPVTSWDGADTAFKLKALSDVNDVTVNLTFSPAVANGDVLTSTTAGGTNGVYSGTLKIKVNDLTGIQDAGGMTSSTFTIAINTSQNT